MGPLQAILDALQDNMDNFASEDYGFEVDRETGDVKVEVYSQTPDGVTTDTTLVRLSTVKMEKV